MKNTSSVKHLFGHGIPDKPTYIFGKKVSEVLEEWGRGDVLRLGSNENSFGPSPKVIQAIIDCAKNAHRYPEPTAGEIRTLIANRYGLDIESVAVSNGSADIMRLISRIYVCPDDEVVVENLTFSEYKDKCLFNQGIPVVVDLDEDYQLDLDKMYAAVTDKTKLVWICNPNNPTGIAIDGDKLEAFIKKLPKDVITIIDEAYIEYASDPGVRSMVGLVEEYNVIVLRTFSKLYGLGGMRMGYAIGRPELTGPITAIVTTFAVSAPTLAAGVAAYKDVEYYEEVKRKTVEQRERLCEVFKEIGWKPYPSQSNFIFVDARMNPRELTEILEKQYGIIIRGNFPQARISVGTPEENDRLIAACREIASKQN